MGPKYLAMTQRLAPLTGSSVTVMVSFTIPAKEKREALADLEGIVEHRKKNRQEGYTVNASLEFLPKVQGHGCNCRQRPPYQ